jgi:hypothetical protein
MMAFPILAASAGVLGAGGAAGAIAGRPDLDALQIKRRPERVEKGGERLAEAVRAAAERVAGG